MRAPTGCPVEAHLQHMQVRGLEPRTITSRRHHLRRLARHLGIEAGEDLLLVTEQDLENWQRSLAGLSPRYRASWIANVRQFYRYAYERRYIDDNPARVLIRPKIPERVPHPMPEQDVDTAIAFAPHRIRPMLLLAAYCGLRAAEIAQLTREQIHDDQPEPVLVIIGKGNKQRVIPLPEQVLEGLRQFGLPQAGPVFLRLTDDGGPSTGQRVSHMCCSYLHDLGIPESLHKLRHFYGTQMYRASKDLRMVQAVMGHASPITTSGYVAYDQSAAHEAAAVVAADAGQRRPRLNSVPAQALPAPSRLGGPAGRGDLTPRQSEVLRLLAAGHSDKNMASLLRLSPATVREHLHDIGSKLGTGEPPGWWRWPCAGGWWLSRYEPLGSRAGSNPRRCFSTSRRR